MKRRGARPAFAKSASAGEARPAPEAAPLDYDESKRLARHEDVAVRRELARRTDLRPEILYYLVEDAVPEVRREVAANPDTPRQADLLLARDTVEAVRHDLARKIARLAPTLDSEQREQIRRATVEIIEILARDQAARVRQVVAEALKDLTDAPPEVIQELARDAEIKVAAPILQFSPLLSDADLIDIIKGEPIKGALAAIARRYGLAAPVTDAIVTAAVLAPAETSTITELLSNASAQIREETLDRILDEAPRAKTWHKPMVRRPSLPPSAVRRLAEFIGRSLLELLQARPDLDPETARSVAATVERRLAGKDKAGPPEAPTGEALAAAIAAGDHKAVAAGLVAGSGLPAPQVEKMLGSQSAKSVTALAWKAGLSMRLAVQLQLRVAGVPPRSVLNPRGGTEYPLSAEEMEWQIEFFAGLG